MPITNVTYRGRKGGVDHYDFTDHTGRVWKEKWKHGPAVTDPVAWATTVRQPKIESQLAHHEIQEALLEARLGRNPDKVPPDHQTQQEFDRRLLAELMQLDDANVLLICLDFWRAHIVPTRSGNNVNARADALGVPRAEYAEVDARFNDMIGVEGGINNVKNQTWGDIPSDTWK